MDETSRLTAESSPLPLAGGGPEVRASCGKDTAERAFERWNGLLRDHQAPPIDPAVDEALRDFIDRKKQSMPDAWY